MPAFFADLSLPRLNQWVLDRAGTPGKACTWTNASEPPFDDETDNSSTRIHDNLVLIIISLFRINAVF